MAFDSNNSIILLLLDFPVTYSTDDKECVCFIIFKRLRGFGQQTGNQSLDTTHWSRYVTENLEGKPSWA